MYILYENSNFVYFEVLICIQIKTSKIASSNLCSCSYSHYLPWLFYRSFTDTSYRNKFNVFSLKLSISHAHTQIVFVEKCKQNI